MPKRLKVKDSAKLANILNVFSALDDVRWSCTANYNLVNYCAEDLTPDEKLLCHWLCYVTDRQTAFERVWEVGGFVLSHLVRTFTRENRAPLELFASYTKFSEDNKRLRLECPLTEPNSRLAQYGIHDGRVEFASRYMPSDALSILRTLHILDRVSQRSFTSFIYRIFHVKEDHRTAIWNLAAALHFLTYADLGLVEANELSNRMATLTTDLNDRLTASNHLSREFVAVLAEKFDPFGKKRLWCSIRDYLKSPEFNGHLVMAIQAIDPAEAPQWQRGNTVLKSALDVIELPGDVWNNNRIFREGLFAPHLDRIPKTWDMPRTLRAIYDQLKGQGTTFYPEQLDVTFDFVPRMCNRRMCYICMFGAGVARLCHQQRDLYCPVTLAACGYVHPCNPDQCAFKANAVAGVCESAVS